MPSSAWQERSSRLFGASQLTALAKAHVVVLGLGGVGSSAALALVRGGVRRLSVLDGDTVELTNLNRQELAFRSNVGLSKVEAFKKLAADINPECEVKTYHRFLHRQEVPALLAELAPFAFVIDALDAVAVKLALAKQAEAECYPLISILGTANRFDPTKLIVADLFATKNCSVARVMRKEARKQGIHHLLTVSSTERAQNIPAQPQAPRSERTQLGTTSYLPAVAGKIAAGYVISELTNHRWETA